MAKYVPVHLNSNIRITVMCNNEIALPALHQLFITGNLKAVVVPEKNIQLISILQPLLTGSAVLLIKVNKKNLTEKLSSFIKENNITAVWLMTFAYILPQDLLNILPGGFINFHYGLLPKYRGANPILSQMLNYEVEGGITVHLVDNGIDTGDIVMQQKIPIEDTDTFGIQIQKLALLGASLVPGLLQFYGLSNSLPSKPQGQKLAQYFKKPTAADLMIKWQTMSAMQVIRLVNACNPWNKGAGAVINGQVICIADAELAVDLTVTGMLPGTVVLLDDKNGLIVSSSDNRFIRLNICYTPEGFFAGKNLGRLGIKINDRFTS